MLLCQIWWLWLGFVCSYPYSEDSSQGKQYMNTRCPAWCDRILMSHSAKELILKVSTDPQCLHTAFSCTKGGWDWKTLSLSLPVANTCQVETAHHGSKWRGVPPVLCTQEGGFVPINMLTVTKKWAFTSTSFAFWAASDDCLLSCVSSVWGCTALGDWLLALKRVTENKKPLLKSPH